MAKYIAADNIVIQNNKSVSGTSNSLGGALYASSSDVNSRGNISIVGNASITGNIADSSNAGGYGGAIYLAGNLLLAPNGTNNTIVFRDNRAKSAGNDFLLDRGNKQFIIDYTKGGNVRLYDGFTIADTSSMLQTGYGKTSLWGDSWGGGLININSGVLSLEAATVLPSTVDSSETTYIAGSLGGYKVNIGTASSIARLDIYDGAELYSGKTADGHYMNISSGNTINLYGSGAINLDTAIQDGFNHFGTDRVINIGSDNTFNLAARTAEQLAANTYNRRGSDGSQFSALHIGDMGSNNTFVLNSDIANNKADKLVISSTAAGHNYIKISYDPTIFGGGKATDATKTLVVEAATGANSGNLQGIFTGAASDIGVYSWTPTVKQEGDNWYIVGSAKTNTDTPSTTVKTGKTMSNALLSTFRLINNDLLKRMGELRFNPNNAGVWLRTYTGESDLKGGGGQRYIVIQGGLDKLKQEPGGKRFTGIALEHINSANTFENGTGSSKIYDIGVYQSWLADSGHYYDVVGKLYRTSNTMNIADSNGMPVQGEYKGWAYGMSLEYGYRKELGKGYFAIPQIEFTYRHVAGLNYTTSNHIDINQKAYDSLVGRAGLTIGRKYNNDSQIYLTANILRELIANVKLSANDSFGGSFKESMSGKETWYNLAIGATFKNGKKNDWYMELERDFGSSCNNKWQVLLGTRWSW